MLKKAEIPLSTVIDDLITWGFERRNTKLGYKKSHGKYYIRENNC